ncbi:hypothetical protein Amsp01_097590 [Amycolatopsis sp. NBRC 101858]|uniref:hypothetical protein n=1 Tax=Amycolatopsis sp. NBRC 101858 TaxID=3032200 RepID=UPI0024A5386B|nr:hypothetical protein [Amycolatopsis sp. NBRC 101858]GLY43736.1 hypothetical protein Amsp01_097590 [Amycolatopsis sp. NBRC 101858]
MKSVFGRRAALRGAAVLAAATALPPGTAEAAESGELTWLVPVAPLTPQRMRTRLLAGIPAVIEYGRPVTVGPVTVQAIGDEHLGMIIYAAGYQAVSAIVTASVVVADARGLSGRLPITVTFPRTPVPTTQAEFVLTGTAILTGTPVLPSARNPGVTTIALDPDPAAVLTFYRRGSGAPTEVTGAPRLNPAQQDTVVARIEVR